MDQPSTVQRERESSVLKQLFELRVSETHAAFGARSGIGSAAMVWQYLNNRRPLNVSVAARFAHAMGVPISRFSGRLAREADVVARALHPEDRAPAGGAVWAAEPAPAHLTRWPFTSLDEGKIVALDAQARHRLEGALLLAAGQIGVEIRKRPAA